MLLTYFNVHEAKLLNQTTKTLWKLSRKNGSFINHDDIDVTNVSTYMTTYIYTSTASQYSADCHVMQELCLIDVNYMLLLIINCVHFPGCWKKKFQHHYSSL